MLKNPFMEDNNLVSVFSNQPENILLDEGFNIKVCDFGWCTEDIENPRRTFCGTYEVN